MPMAIIEALATGLPVIATPVGTIPEILRHDETALLVPPGDSIKLAGAMERIAGDDMLAARLSLQGRQLYERSFGLDRYMRRLLALYAGAPLRQPAGQHQIGDYRGAAAPERR
jgi:glycosyltransferase involved in cell wall biosynthesis